MKEDILKKQREYRQATNNAATNKYEKTKKGKLMRIYRNMKSRINGIQKAKYHLYEGKELLEKDLFYKWAIECIEFHDLFEAWKESGYQMKLAPSVDRVDSSRGYSTDNMEWVTHSENSRRGSVSQARKDNA